MSKSSEYTPLPTHEAPAPARRGVNWKLGVPLLVLFGLLAAMSSGMVSCPGKVGKVHGHHSHSHGYMNKHVLASAAKEAACPKQPSSLLVGDEWNPADDEAYAQKSAQRLSESVQLNTVSYDDLPDDASDPRFDGHTKFAEWLEKTYPSIYSSLDHEMVNTHGHLYTWKGSKGGKPIMLMAHEDTVPVNPDTVDQWTYPPWSGEITINATENTRGTWIWGRGSSDCKNSLTGILGSVEKLLSEGYTPERDVLIAYGFDEEIGGARGAMQIANVVEERYGHNGVAFIIDEGFSGIDEQYGTRVAALGMAEKGSVSVNIKVDTPGGHSSVPPVHTGIGLMSRLLTELEDHPFKPSLEAQSPYLKYMSCLAEYGPEFPKKLGKKIQNPRAWPKLAKELAGSDRVVNSFLATSTAIDLIKGGVKVNALPETVEAVVNHRIAFTSSVNETLQHYVDLLLPIAKKLDLTSTIFGEEHGKSDKHVTFSIVQNERKAGLEPAPITPSDSKAFEFIGGSIRAVFGEKTVIAPTGMFANTDTARTWSLTPHIYRFTPAYMSETVNPHTVDERISLRAHLSTTQFYYRLLRNLEGWEGDE